MAESKYNLRYIGPGEYHLWDQFVLDHPNGTLFHSTTWGDLIRSIFNRPFFICAVFNKNELDGGLLFWPKKSAIIDSIPLTPVTTYQGILIKEPDSAKRSKVIAQEEEITGLILDELKSKYGYIELSLMRHIQDLRPYTWKGFTATPAYTYCFPIKPLESLKTNFSQALRRKINVSEKEDHFIKESDDPEFIVRFIVESYSFHKIAPPVSAVQIEKIIQLALKKNFGKLYYLYIDNKPVGGIFLLFDNKRVFALFSGIDRTARSENYTEYMHASVLGHKEFTGKEFDFLGANTKDFEQFKRSFGGELKTYYRVRYLKNNWIALLLKLREKQHLWNRRLPGTSK